ncbi:hypothetical protein [Streptomyces montanisoli]|uniref:Uncharacterized protein n=1 Tax=Streptomyces montanisoli TaxID=2798581 RepID=A0A940RTH8_9ACTN|nr:hypothetical protein [Streptomyces montanisoli]MBP0456201.1 hypothetical protein [Streptomyces montanisoli]
MLALRLARGSRLLVQLRRLLVAAASAGVGFLLLCTLMWAVGHPEGALLRLLWCAVPAAAAVQLAVAVARTDPGTRPRPGLSAIGLGPVRLTAYATVTTAASCVLGSLFALLAFWHLRGDGSGLPLDGASRRLLAGNGTVPAGAVVLLLAAVPVLASAAVACALRPSVRERAAAKPGTTSAPAGLPWGVALTAAGLAVETYASGGGDRTPLPLPGRFEGSPAGVLGGWALTAVGLALAGPGISHLCGWLLQSARPGAVRLLAGRALMSQARSIGRPLGVLCAVVSGTFAAAALYGPGDRRPYGVLTGLGAVLVIGCALASVLTAAAEAVHSREETNSALGEAGTPAAVLRAAAGVRVLALAAVFAPLTWIVAELAAAPLGR